MRSLFLLLVAAGSIAYAKPLPGDSDYNEIADTIPADTIPTDEDYTNNEAAGDGYVDTKEPSILGFNNDGSTNDQSLAAANVNQNPYCNSIRSRFTQK